MEQQLPGKTEHMVPCPLSPRQRVLYVMLEFWPKAMRRHGGADASQALRLLHDHGYTLFDTRTLRMDGGSEPAGAQNTFLRPTDLEANARWFERMDDEFHSSFGYWTDVIAVASHRADPRRFLQGARNRRDT